MLWWKLEGWSSCHGSVEMNPLVSLRTRVWSPASLSGLGIWPCRELWYRLQTWLGLMLLWLWNRLTAVALILPLAWELSYTVGVALKNKQTKKSVFTFFSSTFLFVIKYSYVKIVIILLYWCIIILVFSLDS